jgi:hypothetical protein
MTVIVALCLMLVMSNTVPGRASRGEENGSRAHVAVVANGDAIAFTGKFFNGSVDDIHLSYFLKTEKLGRSGCSVSNQTGFFLAAGRREVTLSTMTVNLQPADSCKSTLQVLDGETVVACDSIMYHLEGR